MALGIRVEHVQQALAPMLGTSFVLDTPLCAHAAEVLRAYRHQPGGVDALRPVLKERIFGDLRAALGPDMILLHERGVRLRLRLKDVDMLVDGCIGVLLETLRLPLNELRQYAMDSGSLAAMRVMLTSYALPGMERNMWARIVQENFAPDQYASWLNA